MQTLLSLILVVSCGSQTLASQKVRYDNHDVYRVTPKNVEEAKLLQTLANSEHYNFWTNIAVNHHVDVMVPPYQKPEFEHFLTQHHLNGTIFIENVQKLIDNERPQEKSLGFGWTDYHTLAEINNWLTNLVWSYPGKVTLQNAGKTYEGRNITGVHVSFANGNSQRAIFLEGNIHAAEWIGSSVVTYILNELLTSTDLRVRAIAETHDWYVFPVVNPDGFEYSHTTNRTWRKTRVPHSELCVGADPNRNWDFHYNEGGASDDPCSDMYGGPGAFSEPSVLSLSEYLQTISYKLLGYISFHSYSQMLLIPYGYTPSHLDNYDELYEVGLKAIDTLTSLYGTEYDIGDVAEIMYIAAGGSPDWVKGTFGTRITYTYELRDRGTYGFILPADQIIPTAEETFASLLTVLEEFDKLG